LAIEQTKTLMVNTYSLKLQQRASLKHLLPIKVAMATDTAMDPAGQDKQN